MATLSLRQRPGSSQWPFHQRSLWFSDPSEGHRLHVHPLFSLLWTWLFGFAGDGNHLWVFSFPLQTFARRFLKKGPDPPFGVQLAHGICRFFFFGDHFTLIAGACTHTCSPSFRFYPHPFSFFCWMWFMVGPLSFFFLSPARRFLPFFPPAGTCYAPLSLDSMGPGP